MKNTKSNLNYGTISCRKHTSSNWNHAASTHSIIRDEKDAQSQLFVQFSPQVLPHVLFRSEKKRSIDLSDKLHRFNRFEHPDEILWSQGLYIGMR